MDTAFVSVERQTSFGQVKITLPINVESMSDGDRMGYAQTVTLQLNQCIDSLSRKVFESGIGAESADTASASQNTTKLPAKNEKEAKTPSKGRGRGKRPAVVAKDDAGQTEDSEEQTPPKKPSRQRGPAKSKTEASTAAVSGTRTRKRGAQKSVSTPPPQVEKPVVDKFLQNELPPVWETHYMANSGLEHQLSDDEFEECFEKFLSTYCPEGEEEIYKFNVAQFDEWKTQVLADAVAAK